MSGVFRNTQSGDTTCTTLYFTVFLYYSKVRGVRGVLPKSYNEALNFLGSNLGLWPGMGILQLLEDLVGLVVLLKLTEKFQIV